MIYYSTVSFWLHIFCNSHKNVQIGPGSGLVRIKLACRIRIRIRTKYFTDPIQYLFYGSITPAVTLKYVWLRRYCLFSQGILIDKLRYRSKRCQSRHLDYGKNFRRKPDRKPHQRGKPYTDPHKSAAYGRHPVKLPILCNFLSREREREWRYAYWARSLFYCCFVF